MSTIKLKRGLNANVVTSNAADGEILMTTDTNELYRGTGTGNAPVKLGADKAAIESQVTSVENQVYKTTPLDIAKTNFILSATIANQTKYSLQQMVVDQLNDLTGIDTSASESRKYRLDSGILYGRYDFSGGTLGFNTTTNQHFYFSDYMGTSVSVSSIRAMANTSVISGLFDKVVPATATSYANYWSVARNTSNYSEDVISMGLPAGTTLDINKIVMNSFINSSYNFQGLIMTSNNGGALTQSGTFAKATTISQAVNSTTLNLSAVSELRLRGTGVSSTCGSTGYGIGEMIIVPMSAKVVTSAISTGTTPKRILLETIEDLTSSGSSVSYAVSFNTSSYSTWLSITPETLFTNIPSTATEMKIRFTLNNGAGITSYALGWS